MTAALVAAWQAALAAEHRAFFAYGLIGPRLTGAQRALAATCYDAHAALRDATEQSIASVGLVPVATQADYPALYPVDTAIQARARGVEVEEFCASAWRYLYAQAADAQAVADTGGTSLRAPAQSGLTASALRAARWRQLVTPSRATVPFPGI